MVNDTSRIASVPSGNVIPILSNDSDSVPRVVVAVDMFSSSAGWGDPADELSDATVAAGADGGTPDGRPARGFTRTKQSGVTERDPCSQPAQPGDHASKSPTGTTWDASPSSGRQ